MLYRFDELSEESKENAVSLYVFDDKVMECCAQHVEDGMPILASDALMHHMDWRFNKDGERIA